MLREYLPGLERVIGKYRVDGPVETGLTDIYRVDGDPQPGIVLIGDAFQSSCPATGLGLSKILSDVDALSECVPRWMATPGMGVEKIVDFYDHPRKVAADARAMDRAHHHRHAVLDLSLRWRLFRFLLHQKWHFKSTLEGLRRLAR